MSDPATVVEPSVPPRNRPLAALAVLAGICATIGQGLMHLPVHPAETAWLVLLGAVLLQAWRQGRRELPALPWLLCLALGAATAGIAGAGSLGKGLTEWGQLAVQVGVPILVLQVAPSLARPVTTGLVLGLTANTMVAMAQRSSGLAPVAVGGLLGSRMLLAGVCGVLAPFAFRLLGLASRLRLGIAVSVLVVATVALPQSVLVVGLLLLLLPVCRGNRLAWALLLAILVLAVAVRWQQFADFARLRDPDGTRAAGSRRPSPPAKPCMIGP